MLSSCLGKFRKNCLRLYFYLRSWNNAWSITALGWGFGDEVVRSLALHLWGRGFDSQSGNFQTSTKDTKPIKQFIMRKVRSHHSITRQHRIIFLRRTPSNLNTPPLVRKHTQNLPGRLHGILHLPNSRQPKQKYSSLSNSHRALNLSTNSG